MRILGLDLSTKSSGFALLEDDKIIKYDNIVNNSKDVIERIYFMRDALKEFLLNNKVDMIVIEEALPGAHGGNVRTEKVLFYLHAAIDFLLHDEFSNIPVEIIYPNSWRADVGIKTGKGKKRDALKIADIDFVKNKYGIEVNDDIADSILIALSYWIKNNKADDFLI